MRFSLIDRIDELQPGRKIVGVKALSMAEEYLSDHFPGFPVMPGVLMLEAMTQAGAWLVRASEDFAHSMVVLKEARSVKYGHFVEPGQILYVVAEIVKQNEQETTLKARGEVENRTTVGAKLVLNRYNLADETSNRAGSDETIKRELRRQFSLLWQPAQPARAAAESSDP